jgi:hypothetical protein
MAKAEAGRGGWPGIPGCVSLPRSPSHEAFFALPSSSAQIETDLHPETGNRISLSMFYRAEILPTSGT